MPEHEIPFFGSLDICSDEAGHVDIVAVTCRRYVLALCFVLGRESLGPLEREVVVESQDEAV